jgi:GLPGLI family protein
MDFKKTILILFFFSTLNFIAQENKKGLIHYGQIQDLTIGNKQGIDYNSFLIFDNEKSFYVTANDSLQYGINNENYSSENTVTETASGTKEISTGQPTHDVGNQFYYDRKKDSLWSYLRYTKSMYMKEKRPTLHWKLEKESKKIGNFTCFKATANFRGRDYIAWYTIDIPLPYGPWKLNNLPGLILEAYDVDYKIFFYFKNIEYPTNNKAKVGFIKESSIDPFIKWYSYKEYLEISKDYIDEKFEKMIILSKQIGTFTPIKSKIEETYIEISE